MINENHSPKKYINEYQDLASMKRLAHALPVASVYLLADSGTFGPISTYLKMLTACARLLSANRASPSDPAKPKNSAWNVEKLC